MARRVVSKVRHWKQRFDPNVEFIFRRGMRFAGKQYKRGDLVPKRLLKQKLKLENFWEAGVIELAKFEAGPVSLAGVDKVLALEFPEGVTVKHTGNHWYDIFLPDGTKVRKQGMKGVKKWLAEQEGNGGEGDGGEGKTEPADGDPGTGEGDGGESGEGAETGGDGEGTEDGGEDSGEDS